MLKTHHMKSLKKHYKIKANSILESVIALSIISICIYITILVYANVFSPRTSITYYSQQNRINEYFFLLQLGEEITNENIKLEETWMNTNLKEIQVKFTDSLNSEISNTFYINAVE